jgi:short-subunit dehydrogenase
LPALLALLEQRPVEVLVNNAGLGSYGAFAQLDPERELEQVAVDVTAVVR